MTSKNLIYSKSMEQFVLFQNCKYVNVFTTITNLSLMISKIANLVDFCRYWNKAVDSIPVITILSGRSLFFQLSLTYPTSSSLYHVIYLGNYCSMTVYVGKHCIYYQYTTLI